MKIEWKKIVEGIKNTYFPPKDLKEFIEETAKERLAICRKCPFDSENGKKQGYTTVRPDEHCMECACNLEWKSRSLSSECPHKFWLAALTEKEEKLLQEKLEEDEQKSN